MSMSMNQMSSGNRGVGASSLWWLILLEGAAAVIIGLLLIFSPGLTTVVLVQTLGFYWLFTGILSLVSLFVDNSMWGLKLLSGILGILAGLAIIRNPLWSAVLIPTLLVILLAVQAIIQGCIKIYQAFRGGGAGAAVLGILNLIIGIFLLSSPLVAALAVPFVVGILALIGGIGAIVSAFRVRNQGYAPPMQRTGAPIY
jgi:uncharacterized membrane protein HdeD (DUF308 family)